MAYGYITLIYMMYSFLGFGALKSNHEIVWGPSMLSNGYLARR
jgi:hypothetical protein